MRENTRALSLLSLFIVLSGFGLLWLGLRTGEPNPVSTLPPIQNQPVATSSAVFGIEGEKAFVMEVVDGDTVHVLIGNDRKTVRLLGVDTPETKDPRKSVECFGKEASSETKKLLSDREVILQKDITEVDKYRRLLRFIYLPIEDGQTLFVNDYLIREGFAKVLTIPPDVKFSEQFLEAQRMARENKKGLWGRC